MARYPDTTTARKNYIGLTISDHERSLIEVQAKRQKKTLSAWIRDTVFEAIGYVPPKPERQK